MQATVIVTMIALIWALLQIWLVVVTFLNTVHFLYFDHLLALSWEHVNHFFQLHNVLISSILGLVQLLLIFRTVGCLVEDFVCL